MGLTIAPSARDSFRRSHRAAPGHVGPTDQNLAKRSLVDLARKLNTALGRRLFQL